MRRLPAIVVIVLLLVSFWFLSPPPELPELPVLAQGANPEDIVSRGEYLVNISGCVSCHTDAGNSGAPLAGGLKLETEFGDFFTPNITPDETTGIGRWDFEEFVKAMHLGVSPDQQRYYPAFPYTSYTQITMGDLYAMFAYLQTVTPVKQPNKAHELRWYVNRVSMIPWQKLFFKPGVFAVSPGQSRQWNRGAYIADALTHCSECHTPRNSLGVLRPERYLTGNEKGPEGDPVPGITSSKAHGIGEWDEYDLSLYLQEGELPDGDYAGGAMVDVIDNSTSRLTPADLDSLVNYLLTVPE